jgi:hypothetical protein
MTPSGIVLLPTKDGKPMQETEFLALSAEEKNALKKNAARRKETRARDRGKTGNGRNRRRRLPRS